MRAEASKGPLTGSHSGRKSWYTWYCRQNAQLPVGFLASGLNCGGVGWCQAGQQGKKKTEAWHASMESQASSKMKAWEQLMTEQRMIWTVLTNTEKIVSIALLWFCSSFKCISEWLAIPISMYFSTNLLNKGSQCQFKNLKSEERGIT